MSLHQNSCSLETRIDIKWLLWSHFKLFALNQYIANGNIYSIIANLYFAEY